MGRKILYSVFGFFVGLIFWLLVFVMIIPEDNTGIIGWLIFIFSLATAIGGYIIANREPLRDIVVHEVAGSILSLGAYSILAKVLLDFGIRVFDGYFNGYLIIGIIVAGAYAGRVFQKRHSTTNIEAQSKPSLNRQVNYKVILLSFGLIIWLFVLFVYLPSKRWADCYDEAAKYNIDPKVCDSK